MKTIKTLELVQNSLAEPFNLYDMLILHLAAKTFRGEYDLGYDFYIKYRKEKLLRQRIKFLQQYKKRFQMIGKRGSVVNPVPISMEKRIWKDKEKISSAIYWGVETIPITLTTKHHPISQFGEQWAKETFGPEEIYELQQHIPEFVDLVTKKGAQP